MKTYEKEQLITRMNALCDMVLMLDTEGQNNFFKTLEENGILSSDDAKTFKCAVSYRSMEKNPRKYEAMKKAVGERLYAEFNK